MAIMRKCQYVLPFALVLFCVSAFWTHAFAIEALDDADLDNITAQDGISIVLDDFKITYPGGIFSIGGDDGLGTSDAPDGAWFVFEFDRVVQLDVEKGQFDIDAFTANTSLTLESGYTIPEGRTGALISFGEAYFHINNTEALFTLKFGNNPQGNDTDGVTEFADTVCSFALNGSTMTLKSDDAKMYIFPH